MKLHFSDSKDESISTESGSTETDFEEPIDSSKSEFDKSKNSFDLKIENHKNNWISSHHDYFTPSEKALKGFALIETLGNLLSESYATKKSLDSREKALTEHVSILPVNANEPRYTSYSERIRQTPKVDARWSGERGESLCCPSR